MLLKIFNPIKLSKFIGEFLKYNYDFLINAYLTRKFYNLNFLVKNLFTFEKEDYAQYCKNIVC